MPSCKASFENAPYSAETRALIKVVRFRACSSLIRALIADQVPYGAGTRGFGMDISRYFNLGKTQAELDFVNVDPDRDTHARI
jgi:hypothetical protein